MFHVLCFLLVIVCHIPKSNKKTDQIHKADFSLHTYDKAQGKKMQAAIQQRLFRAKLMLLIRKSKHNKKVHQCGWIAAFLLHFTNHKSDP